MSMTVNDCEQLGRLLKIYRRELGDVHAGVYERQKRAMTEVSNTEREIEHINRMDEAAIRIQQDVGSKESGGRS
jgi:hypothetical protein